MTFEQWWDDQNIFWNDVPEHIARRIFSSIMAEREACAKIVEAESVIGILEDEGYNLALEHAAESIRLRSNAALEGRGE